MRRSPLVLALLALILVLLVPAAAQAAPGDLDTTFGSGGIVNFDPNTSTSLAGALAVDSLGRILLLHNVGQDTLAVTRFLPDGAIDSSFGDAGSTPFTIAGTTELGGWGLAMQSDGKIVAAGDAVYGAGSDVAGLVARLLPNGGLDTTYTGPSHASPGVFLLPFLTSLEPHIFALAIDPTSQNAVLAGSFFNGSHRDVVTIRLSSTGDFDTAYHTTGWFEDSVSSGDDEARAVTVDPTGRVVIAGYTTDPGGKDTLVGRYTAAGDRDSTFDGNGVAGVDDGGSDVGTSVALTPTGDVVVAGTAGVNVSANRFHGGTTGGGAGRDTSFGNSGIFLLPPAPPATAIGGFQPRLVLQGDGDIDIAAAYTTPPTNGMSIARLTPAGALDPGFGTGGVSHFALGAVDVAGAMLQPSGKLIVALTIFPPHNHANILRVKTAPDPPPPPSTTPPVTTPPGDHTPPHASLKALSRSLKSLRKHHYEKLRLGLDEAGTVTLSAKVKVTRRGHKARTLTFAKTVKVTFSKAGTHTLRLKAARRARSALAHASKATLTFSVRAVDVAGNRAKTSTTHLALRRA